MLVNNILFCDEVFYLKNIPVLELKIVTIFPKDSEALFNRSSRRTFGGADVQFGNLEGPLTDTGSPSKCGGSGNFGAWEESDRSST